MKSSGVSGWMNVASVSAVLGIAVFAISTIPDRQELSDPEKLWATAVLHSLPARDVDPETAGNLYLEAIKQTKSPSNMYVAFGDFLRGPLSVSIEWNKVFADDVLLNEFVEEPELVENLADDVFSIIDGDDQAVAAYLAAIRADPSSPLPRFRVAVYGKNADAVQSARWLSQNCRDNALGPYLEAAAAVQNNSSAVVAFVQEANRRTAIGLYDDPVPSPNGVIFPQFYENFAGKPVPRSALRKIVDRQNTWLEFRDPLRDAFESVLDHLYEIAQDETNAEFKAAMTAHHASCHQLVFNASGDMLLSLSGIFRYEKSYELIETHFDPNTPEYLNAVLENEQIDRFRQSIKTVWRPRYDKILAIPVDSVFAGESDPVLLKRQLVREIQADALTN